MSVPKHLADNYEFVKMPCLESNRKVPLCGPEVTFLRSLHRGMF